ncbi:conserved hypothetical protein [Vibrio crassostreae]|uniref:hypothetical protein n=1 Tax=Vibrio crassostreae TaxID=246167 RepID=UPI001042DB69|nr:hypothetical protein [Vibrio crassostreae]TCN76912.1 hypothetical protein EDB37_105514 [Vibrio crassostreae]CAK2510145.1 conserved hypothetical protein [Vibrio crassostreae]CAK2520409.1 conserved hypothetical protein [Vibrio crassostreae]CAK3859715.1 conserved hypothetical protein [Vibrio crassostreae]CAK4006677.1 conserved hypothetical protein [Vibrio crassostreae]
MFANKTSFKSLLDAFSRALEYEVTISYLKLAEDKRGPQKLRFGSRKNLACYIFFGQTRAEIEQFFHGTPNGFIGVKFYVFEDGSLCIFNRALQQLREIKLDSHLYLGEKVKVNLTPRQIRNVIFKTLCTIITELDPFFAVVEFEARLSCELKVYDFGEWCADEDRIKNEDARSSGLRIKNKNSARTGHYTPVSLHHHLYQFSFFTPETHKLLRQLCQNLISNAHPTPFPLEHKLSQPELAEMSCGFAVSKLGFLKDEIVEQIKVKFSENVGPPYTSVEAEALYFFESISIPMGITLIEECELESSVEWVLSTLLQERMTDYTFPSCCTFGQEFCAHLKQFLDDSYDIDARCTLDFIMSYFEASFDLTILKVNEQLSKGLGPNSKNSEGLS